MKTLGIVGHRGMVGSVLVQRMESEGDFDVFRPQFFSSSTVGEEVFVGGRSYSVKDSYSIDDLASCDLIISCQGGDYTKEIHPRLRSNGWGGYWIDAASSLRMNENAVIILDPVNMNVIESAIDQGKKDFIGGNCTVSLMLMALAPLFHQGYIEWMSAMTYQAASGGGARHMKELMGQFYQLGLSTKDLNGNALDLEAKVTQLLRSGELDTTEFGAPLAANLLPWIDSPLPSGQTREEWKAQAEANKILGNSRAIPMDGTCVRVGSLRCHAQALTIKMTKDVSLQEIEERLKNNHSWISWVDNNREDTIRHLSPAAISGTLKIGVGRVRKMAMGPEFLNVFTCGDQLLWGAAEPLRRMARILA